MKLGRSDALIAAAISSKKLKSIKFFLFISLP